MHAGVGAYWTQREERGSNALEAVEVGESALITAFHNEAIEHDKYTLDKARNVLAAYIGQAQRVGPWTPAADDWQLVTAEERAELDLLGYTLSYQLDRAYWSPSTEHLVIVDLKTVSKPDNAWRGSWHRSLQMKLYRRGTLRYFDRPNVDIVIEGLDKNASPKLHYVMLPQWSEAMLDEAERQFLAIAAKDQALIKATLFDDGVDLDALEHLALNHTEFNYQDCNSYHFPCPFMRLCDADPEYRQGLLKADYVDIIQDY